MEPFEDWVTVHQDEGEGHTRTELVVNAAQRLFKFTPGWEREAHQDGSEPHPYYFDAEGGTGNRS